MKPILKYPGAKNRISDFIISYIPKHTVYCEPYLGSGAVFFNKEPSYNEILNDLDDEIYNFFMVLRNNPLELADAISLTPYSRKEYEFSYEKGVDDKIEKARIFAIKCWQGFGCGNKYKNGFRRGIGTRSPNPAKAWSELPETILLAAKRLKNAQIEKKDAIELIKCLDGKDTFIYCDPPYMQDVRKKYLYNHELTDEKHIELLKVISRSSCKIMISGYESDLYNTYLKDWCKRTKNTTAECSVKREEVIYMNYDINQQLNFEQLNSDTDERW